MDNFLTNTRACGINVSIQPSAISYQLEELHLNQIGRWKNSEDFHDGYREHREIVRALIVD